MSDENKLISPIDALMLDDFGPPVMSAPSPGGGGFIPAAVFETDPIPDATEETFVCLRGPCKHYMETRVFFQAGNSRGSLAKLPVQIARTCIRVPSTQIDLTDEVFPDCNMWEPLSEQETRLMQLRQQDYWNSHPELAKKLNKEIA